MKGKALAAVIGVFLLGLIGGAFLGQLYPRHDGWGWHAERGLADGGPTRGPRHDRRKPSRFIGILSEELDLSEKQRDEIRPLLTQSRQKLHAARLASMAHYDQIIVELSRSIRPALNGKQIKELDQLTESFRKRRARKRERLQNRLEQLRLAPAAPQSSP